MYALYAHVTVFGAVRGSGGDVEIAAGALGSPVAAALVLPTAVTLHV